VSRASDARAAVAALTPLVRRQPAELTIQQVALTVGTPSPIPDKSRRDMAFGAHAPNTSRASAARDNAVPPRAGLL
jgi:hypothetical protein